MLNGAGDQDVGPHMADYLLLSSKQELPPAGVLGVGLEVKNGECRIRSLSPDSAAARAGLMRGDILEAIGDQTVKRISDVRVALWAPKARGPRAGQRAPDAPFGGVTVSNLEIELTAPAKSEGE